MSSRFIVGNWKMYNTVSQAETLVRAILADYHPHPTVEVAIAPPFIALQTIATLLASNTIHLAAQTVYQEDEGAFTGEISPLMLKAVGCRYVIIGHSERRHVLGETDQDINMKIRAALRHQLHPILCLGERLEEREAGHTTRVVQSQLQQGLAGIPAKEFPQITLAYEPVWAIGTGKAATVDQAAEVHGEIRRYLQEQYGIEPHTQRILYGGSVSPDNAEALFHSSEINGALIGKACLNAESFGRIIALAKAYTP
ncbi:MAG: triose-phosphate isomerase [Nitrospirales bacterium]|nr:triose-phosphate isomerase [Nitrospirales bacterium]